MSDRARDDGQRVRVQEQRGLPGRGGRAGCTAEVYPVHCPWQNGKVERFNRTLASEWAYARVWFSSAQRAASLAEWIEEYNAGRGHASPRGACPAAQVSTT
ncbi:integrase core domain-containing protein [Kocuria palustris]|uniref:integrase core domain-containing protein n=1 Tax=Kocuria palustris TaxID=71999 RepID=UPI003318BA3D